MLRVASLVLPVMGQQCPDYSRILVGQRDRSHILVAPVDHGVNSAARFIQLALLPSTVDDRTRPVNQKGSQVRVTALADA